MRMYSDELWDKVVDENKEILDDYILEIESQGKSKKTIYQYKADIKGFLCWMVAKGKNVSVLELKRRDFRNFFLTMSKDGLSGNRINRMQSSIRNMLNYCWWDDDIYVDYQQNPMAKIKGVPHEPVRKIIFLTDKEINIILDYLIQHEKYQMALYVSLSYASAGRRAEIWQVKKTNFLQNKQTNIVRGKRGKKFTLMYDERTRQIASLAFKQRGEDDLDSLWYKEDNGEHVQLSYDGLYNYAVACRRILFHKTGQKRKINSHSFRHSAIENLYNGSHHFLKEIGKEKLTLNELKVYAHHAKSDVTESYLENKDESVLQDLFDL